jgi:hypothetical protein
MNDLKVCWWPTDKPLAYSRNSRKIPERAIDKVAASIKEFGWRQAIVVDKDGVIICGHTRLLAAKKLGLKQVPVHVADNLNWQGDRQKQRRARSAAFVALSILIRRGLARRRCASVEHSRGTLRHLESMPYGIGFGCQCDVIAVAKAPKNYSA